MSQNIRLVMAQLNFLVGDIVGNTDQIIQACQQAKQKHHADIIVFPELAITGYPPEDLLLRPRLYERVNQALLKICKTITDIDVILGHPHKADHKRYNAVSMISKGKIIATGCKKYLPNYSVFDEARYFSPGQFPIVAELQGLPIAACICEDIWYPDPLENAVMQGAKLMVVLNASPFDASKLMQRETVLLQRYKEQFIPIIYVNLVGGQDELIFDGNSMVIDQNGNFCQRAKQFEQDYACVDIAFDTQVKIRPKEFPPTLSDEETIYQALVYGTKDYVKKNGFEKAIIGLSGGIDSAVTLAIAVDALGKENVKAILMPSRYTLKMSLKDAKQQCKLLGVKHSEISIEPMVKTFYKSLKKEFKGFGVDVTEENIQARCRGIILMAISNKTGNIVLTTGNKSEMSVGYATLYGDMAGGFSVLKDVPKTLVYRLANYRNQMKLVIPQRVIERDPSAELAPDQKDQDVLPPYTILDRILELYIEEDRSIQEIIDNGFEEYTVKQVTRMVDQNEYKRRQAPPGIKITQRAFGRDRRYPITSAYGKENS